MTSDQGSDEFEQEAAQSADVDPADAEQDSIATSDTAKARSRLQAENQLLGKNEGSAGLFDFLLRLLGSLNWSNTSQIAVIVLVLGIAAALIFVSLGVAAYFVIGTSPWLTVGLSIVAGGGASGGTSIYLKAHQVKRASRADQRATDDDLGPQCGPPPE